LFTKYNRVNLATRFDPGGNAWVFDIVPETGKQVQSFRYFNNIIPVLKKLL